MHCIIDFLLPPAISRPGRHGVADVIAGAPGIAKYQGLCIDIWQCQGRALLWQAADLCIYIEESAISLDVQEPIFLVRLIISIASAC